LRKEIQVMNIRELQQSYEKRLKRMRGFIYKQTRENEDLRQEACLAMWRGLQIDPEATDGFLMNRIRWRVRDVWKNGTSVDKPHKTREDITILRFYPQDFENEIYAEYLADRHLPLDEQVIAKVDSERFLRFLDYNEREIVKYKLKGLADRDIILELGITREHYRRVKRGIRPKIREFFSA
jgi:DNA-directed RNA polymerase specialized sigma24 family protein